ncbi:MAG: hypothetical protein AAF530_23625 [Pseudomonadota bacterium]
MTLTVTLSVLAAALVLGLLANIISRRPTEPGKPRVIPYLAIQYLAILVVVLMLAHLITLWTGKPFTGRMG